MKKKKERVGQADGHRERDEPDRATLFIWNAGRGEERLAEARSAAATQSPVAVFGAGIYGGTPRGQAAVTLRTMLELGRSFLWFVVVNVPDKEKMSKVILVQRALSLQIHKYFSWGH